MADRATPAPRAFVSYSWSSPTHQTWVLNLATRLREDGIDVLLDKWDLKPGHDAFAFMEKMVTDDSVTKVIMICDKTYAEKANDRAGGVGAETQILTPELYGKSSQDKFAAAITELDDDGRPYVPAYYAGRIYFDFSRPEFEEASYEELLRWLLDEPLHIKPKLGARPTFITNPTSAPRGTTSKLHRAEDAIRQGTRAAGGLTREFGDALIDALTELKPERVEGEPFDESVIAAAEAMRPYMRQLTDLARAMARYDTEAFPQLLAIYERLAGLTFRPADLMQWHADDFDAYKIIAYEAFLSLIATLLDEERFELAGTAVRRRYLVRDTESGQGPSTVGFQVFAPHVVCLEHRNQRLRLNRLSLQADLVEQSTKGSAPSFEQMMQADFVLFLCDAFSTGKGFRNWYPRTLVFAGRRFSAFELFARSESQAFFDRWRQPILGSRTVEEIKLKLTELSPITERMFFYSGVSLGDLANAEHLGTRD